MTWILPKQLHTSAFVADTKALDLDSEEFSQICEKSLTWRGKDSVSRTWLQRWKRENWMQHLCSRTLRPSHTTSFLDKWTSYLEDSLVSPLALQESVKQLKTQDTSFLPSPEESKPVNLELCFSKTSKESSPVKQPTESQFSSMSSEHWKKWITEQRQEYSLRKKSAHLIRESESSSWPTATVFDTTGGSYPTEMVDGVYRSKHSQEPNSPWYGAKLKDAVETHEKNWATPQSRDYKGARRKLSEDGKNRSQTTGETFGKDLNQQVKNWPTPTAVNRVRDEETMEKCLKFRQSHGKTSVPLYLEEKVIREPQNWGTPAANDANKTPHCEVNSNQAGLTRSVGRAEANWPTATTRDWKDTNATVPPSRANPSKQTLGQRVAHVGLQDQTNLNTSGKNQESWPTPRANKVHPQITEENREHLANRNKANLEEDIAGHCGKATGKLNPNWVEQLMGLPVGWTDLGYWETVSFR